MFDLSSPYAPFLLVAYAIGILNTYQGLFFLYKFFDGYGALFPWHVIKNASEEKMHGKPANIFLVSPAKTTKAQRYMILLYAALYFTSVFILWQITQGLQ